MAVEFNTNAIMDRVRLAAMRGIMRGTEAVRTSAVQAILSPPKTGRVYRRGGVEHQASAPGEAPASDTGRLAGSITTEYFPDQLRGRVTARTGYAAYLEFGTQRMEPRPFMRPAQDSTYDRNQGDIAREVGEALGRG
jgi:HK97 gp10 family phage protein